MTKQTSANNETLKTVKRIFNAKIYKHALQIMNTDGESAVMEYLGQFCNNLDFLKTESN